MPEILKKSFGEYLLALIIALIVLIIYYVMCNNYPSNNKNIEGMTGANNSNAWNRNKCDYVMSETLEEELSKNNINKSETNWNLYFPCGYDDIEKEISLMPVIKDAKYFIIDNSDIMVAKEWLWHNVVSYHGIDKAKTLMPNGYILYEIMDTNRLKSEYDNNKIYIMKKNIQRQEGLKITKSLDEILKGSKDGYVLVQELLQNPYIISGRKTNMRFYVLVVCVNNEITVYAHNDGFMYYTKDLFVKGSIEDGPNITTGYIDRQVYIDNPLTHDDLRIYLDNPNRKNLYATEKNIRYQELKVSKIYFDRIYNLLYEIFISFVGKICKNKKFEKNTMFQLFGVDIAVDDNLNPMIMEINKGPDLGAKDKRDSDLKHGVVRDVLNIVGAIDGQENKFIKIINQKN